MTGPRYFSLPDILRYGGIISMKTARRNNSIRAGILLASMVLALLLIGCSTTRSTTTARTAIEQALLSQTAKRVVDEMDFSTLAGKSFVMKEDKFDATDGKYVLAALQEQLLESKLKVAAKDDDADVLIYPRVAAAAIDDTTSFVGVPSLPLIIPGAGGVTIPELALYKLQRQYGRNRMGVHGQYTKTGELAVSVPEIAKQSYYSRWTILFLISFRTTDLEKPF